MLRTHLFARKPFYVDAVRVSENNIEEVAEWSNGTIQTDDVGQHIKIDVHRPMNDRQTVAYIGDWVLKASSGFKIYAPKAFDKSFEKVKHLTKEQADIAGIRPGIEPKKGDQKAKAPEKARPKPPKNRPRPPLTNSVGDAIKRAEENKKPDVDYRSSVTGQYVDEETAKENPATTVSETEVVKAPLTDDEGIVLAREVQTPNPVEESTVPELDDLQKGTENRLVPPAVTDSDPIETKVVESETPGPDAPAEQEPIRIEDPEKPVMFAEEPKSAADVEADKLIAEVQKLNDKP